MSRIPRIRRRARSLAGLAGVPRVVGEAVPVALATPGGGASMTAGTRSGHGWLSFRRIVDIPFETCVAALESWPRTGQDGELHLGHSLVRGSAEHNRDTGTCRVEIRLARGRLRPPLRMRLDIDRWTWSPARTALELIPGQRVRPTAAYFRGRPPPAGFIDPRTAAAHRPGPRRGPWPPPVPSDLPAPGLSRAPLAAATWSSVPTRATFSPSPPRPATAWKSTVLSPLKHAGIPSFERPGRA